MGLGKGNAAETGFGQTIDEAIGQFMDDLNARNLARSTIRTYSATLGSFAEFAKVIELETVGAITSDAMRIWRNSLGQQPSTQVRMVTQIKAFSRYLVDRNWLSVNPAIGLRPPKFERRPTMPFALDQMRAILEACRFEPQIHALVVLMRFSGLAISDACTLPKDAVADSLLSLRRAKTGEPVTVPLPECVTSALHSFPSTSPEFFFWTGTSLRETVTKRWGHRLKLKFREAGIHDGRPHRLRDTFAVELLQAGTAMEDVSILLGHSSIRITEEYYAPWCPRRRERLNRIVRQAWNKDPLLVEMPNVLVSKARV